MLPYPLYWQQAARQKLCLRQKNDNTDSPFEGIELNIVTKTKFALKLNMMRCPPEVQV